MISIFKRPKKASVSNSNTDIDIDSERIEYLIKAVLALQKSEARSRQDFRQIVRDEIKSVLDRRQRRVLPF